MNQMHKCTQCGLHINRTRIALHKNNPQAHILIMGDAPSRIDDILGKAFCGKDGVLLKEMLFAAGIPIDSCLFVNAVLCRPCSNRRDVNNRDVTNEEILSCMHNIDKLFNENITAVVFLSSIVARHYKKRFNGLPQLTITHPAIIVNKGGKCSTLYHDNLTKLEIFYADHEA
jgi:uracil-DNA glycosylase family 4